MKTKGPIALLISLMFVLVSCETVQINPAEKGILYKAAARGVSHAIVEKNPDLAEEMISLSQRVVAVLESEQSADIKEDLLTLSGILEKIEDPLLRADIKDVLSIVEIGINKPQLDENQKELLKQILKGLSEGARIAGEK